MAKKYIVFDFERIFSARKVLMWLKKDYDFADLQISRRQDRSNE